MHRIAGKSLSRQLLRGTTSECRILNNNNTSLVPSTITILKRGLVDDKKRPARRTPPRPKKAVVPIEESWVSVKDEASGQIYWWNQQTDETTALGAPKPTGPTAVQPAYQTGPLGQPTGGVMSGIGGTIAHGMAFGVGSSIAHHAIGSMFGGGSSHSAGGGDSGQMSSGGGDMGGGGDEWDI